MATPLKNPIFFICYNGMLCFLSGAVSVFLGKNRHGTVFFDTKAIMNMIYTGAGMVIKRHLFCRMIISSDC
ncbi:hypothetical protein ABJ851_003209 [Shigella flexneri]